MQTVVKILAIIIILSTNASGSIWIDDIEIGLSELQTAGYVNNEYFVRPPSVPINDIYYIYPRMSSAPTPRAFMIIKAGV